MLVERTDLRTGHRDHTAKWGIWRVERRRWRWFGRRQYIYVVFDGPPHQSPTFVYYYDLAQHDRAARLGWSLELRVKREAAKQTDPTRWHDVPNLPEARLKLPEET